MGSLRNPCTGPPGPSPQPHPTPPQNGGASSSGTSSQAPASSGGAPGAPQLACQAFPSPDLVFDPTLACWGFRYGRRGALTGGPLARGAVCPQSIRAARLTSRTRHAHPRAHAGGLRGSFWPRLPWTKVRPRRGSPATTDTRRTRLAYQSPMCPAHVVYLRHGKDCFGHTHNMAGQGRRASRPRRVLRLGGGARPPRVAGPSPHCGRRRRQARRRVHMLL